MPIRIQRIEPAADLGSGRIIVPTATAADFGGGEEAALGQLGHAVSGIGLEAVGAYAKAQQALRQQQDQLDAAQKLEQVKVHMVDYDQELRSQPGGPNPSTYAPLMAQRANDVVQHAVTTMTPGAAQRFQMAATPWLGTTTIEAKHAGFRMGLDKAGMDASILLDTYRDQAGTADNPADADLALKKGMLTIRNMLGAGVWKLGEAETKQETLLRGTAEARALKEYQTNPVDVTSKLLLGQWKPNKLGDVDLPGLPPSRQLEMGTQFQNRTLAQWKFEEEQREKARKEFSGTFEKDIEDLTLAGSYADARAKLSDGRQYLTGDKYKEYGDLIRAREKAGPDSDPALVKSLRLAAKDLTAGSAAQVLETVKAAFRLGAPYGINNDDYKELSGHLEARAIAERNQAQSLARSDTAIQLSKDHYELQHGQQLIKDTIAPSGGPLEKYIPAAQVAREQFLEGMAQHSPVFAGRYGNQPVSPMLYYSQHKGEYVGRLSTLAGQYLTTIDQQLGGIKTKEELKAQMPLFKNNMDEFYRRAELLKQAEDIRREMAVQEGKPVSSLGQPSPTPLGGGSAPAPAGRIPAGGQTPSGRTVR